MFANNEQELTDILSKPTPTLKTDSRYELETRLKEYLLTYYMETIGDKLIKAKTEDSDMHGLQLQQCTEGIYVFKHLYWESEEKVLNQ